MVLESSIGTLTFIPEAYLQYLDQNQFLTAYILHADYANLSKTGIAFKM